MHKGMNSFKKRNIYFFLVLSICALLIFPGCQKQTEKISKEDLKWQKQYVDFPSKIKVEKTNIKDYIDELTSDKYEGRKIGTSGEAEASLYLATFLKDLDIPPYFTDSYFQTFIDPRTGIKGENVLGILKKTDNNKYIILSASYDHLGREERGKRNIYPGANDNASGVSAVMEMARILKENFAIMDYNLVFAFWSGHEMNFLGSKAYVDSLSESEKNNIYLVINLDTIGSFSSKDYLIWKENDISVERSLPFTEWKNLDLKYETGQHTKSDHYYFGVENIPAITIRSSNWEAGSKTIKDNLYNVDLENVRKLTQNLVSYIYNLKGQAY